MSKLIDKDKRKDLRVEILSLADMVSVIENTADNTQIFLKEALKNIFYRAKGATPLTPGVDLEAILSTGILQETDGKYNISNQAKKNARKLYTYLMRKFDTELYFDPETCETKEIPKGSTFECVIGVVSGELSLSLKFPDDEITDLLDMFDSNPCKHWSE